MYVLVVSNSSKMWVYFYFNVLDVCTSCMYSLYLLFIFTIQVTSDIY